MKRKIVFATGNENKLKEIRQLLGNEVEVLSLKDIECFDDLPETAETLEGNAMQKAQYVADRYGLPCFADDTGLEVEALNGRPGVYSARYAGPDCKAEDNMAKLLEELDGEVNRSASFRTVIAWISDELSFTCEGRVDGSILREKRGTDGFGYDPLFMPFGHTRCFAEMTMIEKNTISHRGRALKALVERLIAEGLLNQ